MQVRRRRVLLDVAQGNVSSPHHSSRLEKSSTDILRVICLLIITYGLISILLLSRLMHIENHSPSTGYQFTNTDSSVELSELSFSSPSSTTKPRVFGYFFDARHLSQRPPSRLPVHWENAIYELYPSKRQVLLEREDRERQEELENSEEYGDSHHRDVSPYESSPECLPMHEWQIKSFPTCNTIHEKDLVNAVDREYYDKEQVRLIAHGYFRDVYVVNDHDGYKPLVLKTTRYRREFDKRMFDKHRMDAIASDRMTSSQNILPIYGFCGVAGVFAFANGGDLMDRVYEEEEYSVNEGRQDGDESKYLRRLHYAIDIANAISDLHSIDSYNRRYSAIVHADIYPTQFVEHEGKFKLNDFNRCHFMYWNTTSNTESCPYLYEDYNAGTFRSPEEYFYSLQTEKIDVFSMGNMFYFLLLATMPFENLEEENSDVKELVMKGIKPTLTSEILASTSPSVRALVNAMNMCHIFHWKERPSASEIRDYLQNELDAIEAR